MKTLLLQKILFPKDERLQVHWGLFYRASRMSLSKDFKQMYIPAGSPVGFATYLNGFSIQKWRLYTNVKNVTLKVTLKGHFLLNAVGYHLNPIMPDRHEFSSTEYDFAEPAEIQLSYSDGTAEQLLSFEIVPFSECEFSGGAFYADFEESEIRNVNLCLATTTCHKEEFIKKNVQLLKDELLNENHLLLMDDDVLVLPESIRRTYTLLTI